MDSFFFSSRRRHTRSYGDWSSDVCSSDLDDRAVAVDHYGFGRFGKRFSLVAAFHSARAILRNGNFEGHRLRPGRGIARCRRTGARAGFGSCQRVRILDDKRHRAHTCEAEFAVCPLETRFPYRGYLFYLLLLRRKPTIVQAYHFWLSNNCSRVQERMATSGHLFSRLVTIWP